MEIVIKDKLLEIAVGIDGIADSFYGSDFEANLDDDSTFPYMHIQRITQSGTDVNPNTGTYKDNWSVFIFFANKTEMDSTPDENEVIVQDMRELAKEYLSALNRAAVFELITSARYQSLYYKMDRNLVGVLMSVTLKQKVGNVYC